MSKYCENCGTRLCNGICPNCEEENYIAENQGDYIEEDFSDSFMEKVREQEQDRRERLRRTR